MRVKSTYLNNVRNTHFFLLSLSRKRFLSMCKKATRRNRALCPALPAIALDSSCIGVVLKR